MNFSEILTGLGWHLITIVLTQLEIQLIFSDGLDNDRDGYARRRHRTQPPKQNPTATDALRGQNYDWGCGIPVDKTNGWWGWFYEYSWG
ncbi:MAG: hypothetical protein ACYTXY_08170 [Nostoc sp.]